MTREEAIELLCAYGVPQDEKRFQEALDMAIKALSADAEQGEWIHDGQKFKGGLDWCHCSVCGQKTSTHGLSIYNFCPNCGARMKGGAE